MQNPHQHGHHQHHLRHPRPPHQQQNLHQQLVSLLSAASAVDSPPEGPPQDAARVAALESLQRTIAFPPNALLLPSSAPFLAQGLSPLFSDQSYAVSRAAVVAYGTLCGVLCSPLANQGQQYPTGGGFPDGFVAWALPLLREPSNPAVAELALEGLRAMLSAGDPAALDRFIHPIVRACQDVLEDDRTTLSLLRHLLAFLSLLSAKFVHSFRPHFADIVDVLLGWAFVPDLSDSDRGLIMDTFFQFQGHWLSSLPFSLGLLSKFLGDMEVLGGPSSTSGARLSSLLSCFSTLLGVMASAAVTDARLLDQMVGPLQSITPRLLRCMSAMFGSDVYVGRSKWMGESWQCVILLSQILRERFAGFYEMAIDIVSLCLGGAVPSFQLDGVLKSNLRMLSLQGSALLPSSVKSLLQFHRPISQLRLHPNNLIVSGAVTTYLYFLQHGSDGVVSQAISCLLEELESLKGMLEKAYCQYRDVGSLSLLTNKDKQTQVIYSEQELHSLINFDLKSLLTSINIGNADNLHVQITVDKIKYTRATRLASFILREFTPFSMPLSGSPELQLNILRTLRKISEVELLSKWEVFEASHKVGGSDVARPGEGFSDPRKIYLDTYGIFLANALDSSQPLALKLEALDWVHSVGRLLLTFKEKLSGACETCDSATFPNVGLFAVLDLAYDLETKARYEAASSLEALLLSGLVNPSLYPATALVALDKLGDPESSVRENFLKVMAIALPATVHTCGFLHQTNRSTSRKKSLVSMVHQHCTNWQYVLAVKQSTRKFHSQQFVTISSYIANRWKLPLSSWVQRTVFSCRTRNDVLLSQQDAITDTKASEELLEDAKMVSCMIDRICPVSNVAAIWWCIHEAARYSIHLRLRTNLGGPAQTFAAFERMLLDVPNLLMSEASSRQADIGSTLEVSLLPMRLLLDFVESLKKNIYNAYEGSFLLHSPPKPSTVFFRANKKVCEEWFSRICDPMLNASLALHCKDATLHYCGIKLMDLRNTVLSSFKERTNEGISILRDNSKLGTAVLKLLRHAALALCRSHEADALIGLQKWAEASFSTLFGSSISSPFSWISGLVYQAEGRHEMAAAYYSHLLQSEEALCSMDSEGIQFLVSRTIECYTSLSDWKCLENWLTELQTLRSVHAGKPYSGALTTAGEEINAVHALARFDEEDYTSAWTYLDLTPKSSTERTLDSKVALERSEQMLIRSMLSDNCEGGGSKEGFLEKARLILHEALSVAPFDGITTEAAEYAAHLHCISAIEELTKADDDQNKPDYQCTSIVGSVNQLFPMEQTHQDCGMWMKVLRVYRYLQPTSLPTLNLSQKLLGLARKQGNFMLAHRMKNYLLNHSLTSSRHQGNQQELFYLTTQYESILLNHAEGNSEEALTQLWLFVSPDILSSTGSLDHISSGADLKAKACLKLCAWLDQESSINYSSSSGGIISKITDDFNASSILPGNPNFNAIFQEVIGIAAKTATRLCPTFRKTWLYYGSWCFSLARSSFSAPASVLSACSLSSALEQELPLANHHLIDEEVFKVETIVRKLYTEPVQSVSSLAMQVVSLIQGAASAPGCEARDCGESLSSLLSSQLRAILCTANSSFEKNDDDDMLGSVIDELIEIWWSLRQRRVSLFKHAASGYFQYLSYSSVNLDSSNKREDFLREKEKSNTLRAVLNLLHIILNYGLELREALHSGLSNVPILPWQEVIPQLFARLSSHPETVVRKQLEGLLMMLGRLSPCSIVYPTLVNINSSEGNPSDGLQHILDLLLKHYPKLVEDVRLVIDELGMITVLWEEQWLSTLQDLHSDVMRRINVLKEEAARIAANPTLSVAEKSKINTTKYSAMMAPVIVALERRLATTSREPRTPHETWFRKEYGEKLALAISVLKTAPSSSTSTALGEVWRQFEAIAASLMIHHRKSTVSMSVVAPNLARVSTSEIPMPGFEKTSDGPGTVTVASFCEQIIVLSTKTKPKKLVLLGSDGQKYTYLLKGREDLRLDARIMQLLEAINSFLGSFRETRSRSLAIRYYSVTPISARAGLIQWVENVSSIYSVYKSWQKRMQLAQIQLSAAGGGSGNTNNEVTVPPVPRPSDMFYGKIIPALKEKGIRRVISRRDWPHDVKRKVFLELMQETPRQLLWQEMWCASEGFRSFNLKIKRFCGSVAAMSMVGHILGLGDRHLDNILMDLCSGDIVHIDYNICFDKGKRLKIPEIVPFRLTQIMEAALGLSGIEGTFRASCESVMTALQRNKDVILMLLEVFVWEPLTEWTRGGNAEDEAVLVGEEKKGMDLAVSLSLFSSRLQEIRVPLQEHHDLLITTLPAAESALKSLLDEFVQYEVRSTRYNHAEKERSTLAQQECSAKSLLAEATALSENSHVSFELQSHELAHAKSAASEKAQELAAWVDLHAQILDSLSEEGSIPTSTTNQLTENAEDLSLISAVLRSGVPLSVVPEPTKSLCADLDKDVSMLMADLKAAISNATNALKKYALVLRRVLPRNYITTSPISCWAQILQLSVNNLSSDMLSLAKREASELLSKAQVEGGLGFSRSGDSVKQRYLELIHKIESYIAEMGRLDSECSDLMNSIESDRETQSRELLFAAIVKYVESPGNSYNEEKRSKVLQVLRMAVREMYMGVRSKALDLSNISFWFGDLIVADSGGSPKIGKYRTGFQDFQEQIEKCALVSGFVSQVEEAVGMKLSGHNTSSEKWAPTFQSILNASNYIIEQLSEVAAVPEIVQHFLSQKSEVMELFASFSKIHSTVNSAIEKLVEVERERASMSELEQNYFTKAGVIKERQLALEEAAARGRDHLSWEEADELASQEESCRAQLEQLHLTWNQKDMRLLSLRNMETSLINSLISSEQYLSSLLATNTQEGRRSNSFVLLARLMEPFSELESLDLLLPSEFGGSMALLPDMISSGGCLSKMSWALYGLLRNHSFFSWKVGLVGSILDSCLHEASSVDHNFGIDHICGSLKRKIMDLLYEHVQCYMKDRVVPSLVLQLDKEIDCLQSMGTSDEGSRDHLGAVNRVVNMLEEYCNAHETTRTAKSSTVLMKRQIGYLTDALSKAVLETVQLEWLHDIPAPYAFKNNLLSQNIFGNDDESFLLILNVSRKNLLDEIQSSVSSIVRSVEGLQGCERASLPVEGQLERAMGWACAGISSTVPSDFHEHLMRRRRLLSAVGDQASALVEICTSVIELEASRDGLFLASGAFNSYKEKGRMWQSLVSTYLMQLDAAYHSFTCAEQEGKLAQHNMETATSTLLSVSSQLSTASAKTSSYLADIQETLSAMRARARQAVEALSAFSRVSKGHSALTAESGSLIEEVLAITEGLHDLYSLGKEASTAHSALMIDLSKANSILLPLEASLTSDLADALLPEKNDIHDSLGSRSLFVYGKTLYQSYNFKVREACRSLAPLVPAVTLNATRLHSLLMKLGRTSSVHAGNLHKALEGIGESQGVRSEELSLSKSVVTSSQADNISAEREKDEATTEESSVVCAEATAPRDEYWISPPLESCASDGNSSSPSDVVEAVDIKNSEIEVHQDGSSVVDKDSSNEVKPSETKNDNFHAKAQTSTTDDQKALSGSIRPIQGKNEFALSVLKQVEQKIQGRDLHNTRLMGISELVEHLVKQATSIDNLCNMYEGWTPWI